MRIIHLPAVRALRSGVAGLVVAAALVACGNSGSPDGASVAAPASAGAGGRPGGRGFDPAQFQKIRECLSAAGISLPTPSGRFRSPDPSGRPTGTWTRTARPSGAPSDRHFPGPGRRLFADPKVRAALEACGIAMPTGRPDRPTGSPTS